MDKIAKAFVKAQKEFSPAIKTHTNPRFESKYTGLDDCVEAVIDALNSNDIALIQKSHESDNGVAIETIFLHESGETLSGGIFRIPAIKQDAQAYGSALTYARRYSLMSACGIAPEKDDDGNAASKPAVVKNIKPINIDGILKTLTDAPNIDILKGNFTSAMQRCDASYHNELTAAKDKRKNELTLTEVA